MNKIGIKKMLDKMEVIDKRNTNGVPAGKTLITFQLDEQVVDELKKLANTLGEKKSTIIENSLSLFCDKVERLLDNGQI